MNKSPSGRKIAFQFTLLSRITGSTSTYNREVYLMRNFWNEPNSPMPVERKSQTVVGTLVPIAWDRRGKPIKFSIYSDEGEDLIVKEYHHKNQLRNLKNRRVLAEGVLYSNRRGDKFIKLKKIEEILGPNSPSENIPYSIFSDLWEGEFSLNIPKEYANSFQLETSLDFAC